MNPGLQRRQRVRPLLSVLVTASQHSLTQVYVVLHPEPRLRVGFG